VNYADIGNVLVKGSGKIDESFFTDGLHPNSEGYRKLSEALKPFLVNR
jgi:lysophospholipase L1-like esterase